MKFLNLAKNNDISYSFLSYSLLEKRVYELNTSARRIRIQSAVSLVEQTVVPVVKSKVTEVNFPQMFNLWRH